MVLGRCPVFRSVYIFPYFRVQIELTIFLIPKLEIERKTAIGLVAHIFSNFFQSREKKPLEQNFNFSLVVFCSQEAI